MIPRIDHSKMYDDLFIEMLDVFFNSILYLRDVYPSGIFRRRRIYSTAIYASIYPPLNNYLKKVLKTASDLKSQQKLRKVELVIFKEEFTIFDDDVDEQILEKFVFQIEQNDNNNKWQDKMDLGEYLMEYEEQVRQALYQINYVMKNMKPLDGSECGFRIELETTQDAFVDLVNKSNSQAEDFSWIKVNDNDLDEESPNIWRFLPIMKTNYFNMLFQTLRQ